MSEIGIVGDQNNGFGSVLLNEFHTFDNHQQIDICFVMPIA
jgi:hypothetical protein